MEVPDEVTAKAQRRSPGLPLPHNVATEEKAAMITGVFPQEGAFCPALFIRKSLEAEKPPHLRHLRGSEFSPATARDGLKAPELRGHRHLDGGHEIVPDGIDG